MAEQHDTSLVHVLLAVADGLLQLDATLQSMQTSMHTRMSALERRLSRLEDPVSNYGGESRPYQASPQAQRTHQQGDDTLAPCPVTRNSASTQRPSAADHELLLLRKSLRVAQRRRASQVEHYTDTPSGDSATSSPSRHQEASYLQHLPPRSPKPRRRVSNPSVPTPAESRRPSTVTDSKEMSPIKSAIGTPCTTADILRCALRSVSGTTAHLHSSAKSGPSKIDGHRRYISDSSSCSTEDLRGDTVELSRALHSTSASMSHKSRAATSRLSWTTAPVAVEAERLEVDDSTQEATASRKPAAGPAHSGVILQHVREWLLHQQWDSLKAKKAMGTADDGGILKHTSASWASVSTATASAAF